MRICVIVYCSFLPHLRYGRPYMYSLAMNRLGSKVTVLSVSSTANYSSGQMEFGRLINVKETVFSRMFGIDVPFRVLNQALKEQSDIYYLFAPTPLLVSICLKILGKKVVYDIGDDHPSLFTETLIRKMPALRIFRKILEDSLRSIEGGACKLFDFVITLTESLKNDRLHFTKKIKAINYCTYSTYNPENKDGSLVRRLKDFHVLIYVGEISKDKGLEAMLETTNILTKQGIAVKLLLIGSFCQPHTRKNDIAYFDDYLKRNGLEARVELTGWIPYKDVPKYVTAGDIGFVLINPWCYSYKISIPDKAIDILSCGIPIIATKDMLEVKYLIEKSKAGLIVNSEDPELIARALFELFKNEKVLEQLKNNAAAYSNRNHSLKRLIEQLREVISVI